MLSSSYSTVDKIWWQVCLVVVIVSLICFYNYPQVELKTPVNVEAVAVAINSDTFQHFTIFVIELLEDSKALYKPCSTFEGFFEEPRAVFLCNEGKGHFGEFVYIKDDRKEKEYFGLCEVQVFPFRSENFVWPFSWSDGWLFFRPNQLWLSRAATRRYCHCGGWGGVLQL